MLVFGGKKIPEIARALGKGMNEFHKAKRDITDSLNESIEEDENEKKEKLAKEKKIESKDAAKKSQKK